MTSSAPPLDIQFDRSGPRLTVYIGGDLDMATAPLVTQQVMDEIRDGTNHVELDVSSVGFCDSSGLKALVTLHHHVTGRGASFNLYQASTALRRALAVTGIDRIVAVVGGQGPGPQRTAASGPHLR